MKKGFCSFGTGLTIMIGFIVVFGTIQIWKEATTFVKYDLKQLSLSNNISGRFFLGCGSINSELTYYMYTVDKNQTIRPVQVLWSRITIFEDINNVETPYLLTNGVNYRVHIPKDSIKSDYKINFNESISNEKN